MGKRAERRLRRKMARQQKKYLKQTAIHNFHETQKNMDYIFNGLKSISIKDNIFIVQPAPTIKPSFGTVSNIPSLHL